MVSYSRGEIEAPTVAPSMASLSLQFIAAECSRVATFCHSEYACPAPAPDFGVQLLEIDFLAGALGRVGDASAK